MYWRFPITRNISNKILSTHCINLLPNTENLILCYDRHDFYDMSFYFSPLIRLIPFTTHLRTALDTPLNRSEPLPLLFVQGSFTADSSDTAPLVHYILRAS